MQSALEKLKELVNPKTLPFKVGDEVVIDYEDGPKRRQYGTIVSNKTTQAGCYLVLEDNSNSEHYWHYTRTQLVKVIESPLYKALNERKN